MGIKQLYQKLIGLMGGGLTELDAVEPYNPVYDALAKGIDRIKAVGLERITLSLHEASPWQDSGSWIDKLGTSEYFPFQNLSGAEKELILGKKSYERVDLIARVSDNFPSGGVDIIHRTWTGYLSPMKPTSERNYISRTRGYVGGTIKSFARLAQQYGLLTEEKVNRVVEESIQGYLAKSKAIVSGKVVDIDTRRAKHFQLR